VFNLLFKKKKETLEDIGVEKTKGDLDLKNQLRQEKIKKEILCYQKVLKKFGLSFETLVEQCPRDIEEKKYIVKVAKMLVESKDLKKVLFQRKKIPIRQLEKLVSVNKKIIECHYNYIFAIAIILAGDYVHLKDYIKGCWNHHC
jgi:RNA polymerase sigma factor